MTEAQASEIISKIDVAGWWRPIVDHLAARWALDRIAELERLNEALAERVAAQAEMLAKRAEK